MGQKVHPTGARVGIIKDWNSKWYADSKDFANYLVEDQKIRKFLKKKLYTAGISKIEIERTAKMVKINLYTAKPGIIIGKGGAGVEALKAEVSKLIGKDVNLNIVEVKNIDTDAQLVAENIAGQLERRISFRRAMKQCMQKSLKAVPSLGNKFFKLLIAIDVPNKLNDNPFNIENICLHIFKTS